MNTIKAWKDEDFRLSLTNEERAQLPANPAGIVELTDEALDSLLSGGVDSSSCCWDSCNGETKEPEIANGGFPF
jgi:mersacidin/lichenicidin family type 2 lantibiotic